MQSMSCVALFGDVRVSYAGRGEVAEFGIQKIHNLGLVSGVGFAGSVEIGLSEVRRLRAIADAIGDLAEIPDIIDRWYQDALDGYSDRYDEDLRNLGCELIFVGMSREKVISTNGRGIRFSDPTRQAWHQTHGSVVRFPRSGAAGSPPEYLGNFGESIGIGSNVEAYVKAIRENASPGMLKLLDISSASQSVEAVHIFLSACLSAAVQGSPTSGVSAQLVGAVINEEAGCLRASDYGEIGSGPLPRMASSLADLQKVEEEFRLRANTRAPSFGVV
jgi:hypothetical protein